MGGSPATYFDSPPPTAPSGFGQLNFYRYDNFGAVAGVTRSSEIQSEWTIPNNCPFDISIDWTIETYSVVGAGAYFEFGLHPVLPAANDNPITVRNTYNVGTNRNQLQVRTTLGGSETVFDYGSTSPNNYPVNGRFRIVKPGTGNTLYFYHFDFSQLRWEWAGSTSGWMTTLPFSEDIRVMLRASTLHPNGTDLDMAFYNFRFLTPPTSACLSCFSSSSSSSSNSSSSSYSSSSSLSSSSESSSSASATTFSFSAPIAGSSAALGFSAATWDGVRNSPTAGGIFLSPTYITGYIGRDSSDWELERSVVTYNVSGIPSASTVVAARMIIVGASVAFFPDDSISPPYTEGMYMEISNHAVPPTIADWDAGTGIQIDNSGQFPDGAAAFTFDFGGAGISYLQSIIGQSLPTGYAKFMFRETYDFTNANPDPNVLPFYGTSGALRIRWSRATEMTFEIDVI